MDLPKFLVIEGNIGAGKTSLTTKLAKDFNYKPVYERFADNPFLPKFYKDPERYSFPLELSFLADRYNHLTEELTSYPMFNQGIIADYFFPKTLIFARKTLSDDEFVLFKELFFIIFKKIPKPDVIIFLSNPIEKLLSNISKRGRFYEQELKVDYLHEIHQSYIDFFTQNPDFYVKIMDCSNLDFIHSDLDYNYLCNLIFKTK